MPEEDVIHINDGDIELIGNKRYIIYKNGEVKHWNSKGYTRVQSIENHIKKWYNNYVKY